MAITHVLSGGGGGGATVSIPAHQSGDLILILTTRGSSSSAPGVPAGFTSLATSGIGTQTCRLSYKVSDGAAIEISPSTTIRNEWLIYRGQTGLGAWANATTASADNPAVVPAIAEIAGSGGSLVAVMLNFQTAPTNSTSWTFTPVSGSATLTRRSQIESTASLTYDTGSSVSAWPGGTIAYESNQNANAFSVEILGDPAGDPVAVNFTGTVPTLNGTVGGAFSESVASYFSGTETPFVYSVQAGTLPAGLTLNTSTGVISGTPTTAGTASGVVIRATDATPNVADTNTFDIVIAAASDVTAPVLTLPTGTTTGATTASGTVTTDEANGTLYAVVTTSATPPSAADIRAGTGAVYSTSQAVSATGVQNVAATGLTASTAYYWHFLHDDAAANASNIVTSASFTTDALPTLGWTTVPAVVSVTTNSITVSATPNQACDVFAVAIRKTQTAPLSADVVAGQDGDQLAAASANSASYTDTPVSFTLTGLTADPIYDVYVVAHIPV